MTDRPKIEIREASWADPVGAALRQAMETEMQQRYADRIAELTAQDHDHAQVMGVDADHVAYVGVAYDEDGLPVGHAALRWTDRDLELKRMYVTPDAVRVYEPAGYTPIPIFPPYEWLTFSICMEKVL